MGKISVKRWAQREEQLDALGPRPPWWRFFARRAWDARYSAIMAMGITEYDEMLAEMYSPQAVAAMANRPHPALALIGKAKS